MEDKLKPCLFYGTKTIYVYQKQIMAVCSRCKVKMVRSNKKRLIEAWNRHAEEK